MRTTTMGSSAPILVFLDIDGVLNHRAYRQAQWDAGVRPPKIHVLDPESVQRLEKLLREAGAYWVLTSQWRRDMPLARVETLLWDAARFGRRSRGRTPVLDWDSDGKKQRGWEIQWWLRNYVPEDLLPETRICILDDDSDMAELEDRLVLCDHEVGLTYENVEQALEMLSKPLGDTSHWANSGWNRKMHTPPPVGPRDGCWSGNYVQRG